MDNVIGFKPKEKETVEYEIVYEGGDKERVTLTSFGVSQDNSELMVFFDSTEDDLDTPPFLLINIKKVFHEVRQYLAL